MCRSDTERTGAERTYTIGLYRVGFEILHMLNSVFQAAQTVSFRFVELSEKDAFDASMCDLVISGRSGEESETLEMPARMDLLIDMMPVPVLVLDRTGCIVQVNSFFHDLFREQTQDFQCGVTCFSDFITQVSDLEVVLPGRIVTTGSHRTRQFHEERKVRLSDSVLYIDVVREDILGGGDEVLGGIVLIRDITNERKRTVNLEKNAYQDPLTGLQNRRGFYTRTVLHLNVDDVVCYVDVDQFKRLNDVWGHDSGDMALVRVAGYLRKICPVAARLGGDEFVLYFTGMPLDQILRRLVELSEAVRDEMVGRFRDLSLSIGVAIVRSGQDIDDVVRCADAAMYNNKRIRQEYERLCETLRNLPEDAPRERRETLLVQLENARRRVSPYTMYKSGMQSSGSSMVRQRKRSE